MKKFLIFLFAMALTACGAQATPPAPAPVQPSPVVIVNTVVVTSVPTNAPPTPIPSVTPLPPTAIPTLPPPTEALTQVATQAAPPLAPAATASSGPIQIDPKFNGQSFKDMSVSGNLFYLRCAPKEISFDATTTDVYITRVDLYFRIRDKHSTFVPDWALSGTMKTDGLYHFWFTLKSDDVKADLRKAQGWFDFEFVGINKLGDVVGRSEKITDLVSFAIDCK